jgi:hypothetical protein
VPGEGVLVEEVKGVKYALMLPEINENGEKMDSFPALLGL